MLEYKITANVVPPGTAIANANQTEIHFDATSGRDEPSHDKVFDTHADD